MGLFRKKQIPIPDLYKKHKISAEEIVERCAYSFLKAAYNFNMTNLLIAREIQWHNNENARFENMINSIISGKLIPSNLDILIMSNHKNKKANLLADIRNRNMLDITTGYLELECIYECDHINSSPLFCKQAFLEHCLSARNLDRARIEKGDFVNPTPIEIELYYDICMEYLRLVYAEKQHTGESPSDMFGFNGTILLTNGQGKRIPAEEDPLADLVEIDYKGVV